ncbi:alpha/beta hydrolase [Schleiferia thermophila]|jgi:pimeloyl-ACP methyl ester carboxylesterase|uniref:alpha/beta hydrolase n=1 Tax=Schleiferia thermophila TaxID=884107 RepID=UPI0004E7551F|nr:alpha/beta hydrolase [Schleiferia thermophila]KFD38939.1 alpha/beta hydrolase [Schleiferia thermophila str. Yellowstone]PMB16082.1 alpha/beta hydrolase [Fischerella thermalis CCMEE 5319]
MAEFYSQVQTNNHVYLISGLGADQRAFSLFTRYFQHKHTFLPWIEPLSDEPLEAYALRMARGKIDTRFKRRIGIGLSFGGIIGRALLEKNLLTHLILISSVKSPAEFRPLFRILRVVPVYRWVPATALKKILLNSGLIIPSALRHEHQCIMAEMFAQHSASYYKWAIHTLLQMPSLPHLENIYHVHGTHDEVFPIRYICNAIEIAGGSHLMILTRGKDISRIIEQIVSDLS